MPSDNFNDRVMTRSIDEVLADLEAVAMNFDKGWRAEPPTMAALFRRAARDIRSSVFNRQLEPLKQFVEFRSAIIGLGDIESEMREQACGSQDGYILSMADRIRAELCKLNATQKRGQ